jgi:hypothetical protein
MRTLPSIDAVRALDGKYLATLDNKELGILNFYKNQGRKHGVSLKISNEAAPLDFMHPASLQYADDIPKPTDSIIRVTVQPV